METSGRLIFLKALKGFSMDMDKFQKKALESVAVTGRGIDAFAHRTLGLTGEAGAVANRMKKIIRDSDGVISDEDKEYFKLKLGDTLYYVAILAELVDLKLGDVANANLEKSKKFKTISKAEREQERAS